LIFSLILIFVQHRRSLVSIVVTSYVTIAPNDNRLQWFTLVEPLLHIRYAVAFRCRCACIHPGHSTSMRTHDHSDDRHHRRKEEGNVAGKLVSLRRDAHARCYS